MKSIKKKNKRKINIKDKRLKKKRNQTKMYFQLIFILCFLNFSKCSILFDRIYIAELFTKKIEPKMFNWTFQGLTEQFQYRPSLKNYPDLPEWLNYMYSDEYHAGFLYGTPPENLADKEV